MNAYYRPRIVAGAGKWKKKKESQDSLLLEEASLALSTYISTLASSALLRKISETQEDHSHSKHHVLSSKSESIHTYVDSKNSKDNSRSRSSLNLNKWILPVMSFYPLQTQLTQVFPTSLWTRARCGKRTISPTPHWIRDIFLSLGCVSSALHSSSTDDAPGSFPGIFHGSHGPLLMA